MVDVQNFNLVPNDEEEEFLVDFGEVNQITTTDFNKLENRPSYDDVTMTGDTNIPKVPSKTSELSNDSDYQTGTEVESAINAAIEAIDIPSKTSDLTNDGADGTSTYVEADDLAQVATTGDYNDLNNQPTIPAAQVNSDWNATSGVAEILNKPTIPTVNDATLTITQNGTSKGTFTANDADDTTIDLADTTYTAGNAISIDNNNVISAAIYPEDFFTANATVTGTGSEIALQKTIPVKLVNVELDGDSFQQVYTGKNLLPIDSTTRNSNGIIATTDANTGIAILDGETTATAASTMYTDRTIVIENNKTYTLSANNPVANSSITLRLYAGGTSYPFELTLNEANATYTFTATADYTLRAQWRVSGTGVKIDNFIIKPMLELGSQSSIFEPYVGGEPAPSPDYPQSISVVTGNQTVTISDGTNSNAFTVGLGSIELCKLGSYQDYIYKSGSDWYVHKDTGKVTLTGGADETWSAENNNVYFFHAVSDAYQPENRGVVASILCNYYEPNTYNRAASTTIDYGVALDSNNAGRLAIRNKDCANTTELKTWLASHNTSVYYPLASPTDTEITDASLIAQLDALMEAKAYSDTTNIVVTATSTNLPAILEVDAYTNSLAGIIGCLGDIA